MTAGEITADAVDILLMVVILLTFVLSMIALKKAIREEIVHPRNFWFALVLGILFVVYLFFHILPGLNMLTDLHVLAGLSEMSPADWAQIFLVLGLVGVTAFYALMAFRQAKEMTEQRYGSVYPVVDIVEADEDRDSSGDACEGSVDPRPKWLSCRLHNIGLGPALEVKSQVCTSSGSCLHEFGIIGKGYCIKAPCLSTGQPSKYCETGIVVRYVDVFGRCHETSRAVNWEADKPRLGPLRHYQWTGSKENNDQRSH